LVDLGAEVGALGGGERLVGAGCLHGPRGSRARSRVKAA
jgi:hypothetical protein